MRHTAIGEYAVSFVFNLGLLPARSDVLEIALETVDDVTTSLGRGVIQVGGLQVVNLDFNVGLQQKYGQS